MSEKVRNYTRRNILKAAGGLCVSAPLMRLLINSQVAQAAGPVSRLVMISGEHAGSTWWWRPQGGETDFSINFPGAVLSPLNALRAKLLILNGVGNYVGAGLFGGVENHESRAVTFTARANNAPGEPNRATGPSVDQAIINKIGETRPLHASIGGVNGAGSEYYYSGPGYAISGVHGAVGIFDALFAGSTVAIPGNTPQDAALRAMVGNLLAQQGADAKLLQGRLGPEDRRKVEAYLAVVDEKIRSLSAPSQSGILVPTRPATDPSYGQPLSVQGPFDRINKELDLVADGLILGVTRVACLRLDHEVLETAFLGQSIESYDDNGTPLGPHTITSTHADVSHAPRMGDANRNLAGNLMSRDIQLAQAKMVGRFLERLDGVKEIDGSSVLDNTLVVWTSQLSDTYSHRGGRLPYVLAGGLGQKVNVLRMGRYLDYLKGTAMDNDSLWAQNSAVASNRLLNTMLRVFGIEQDSFGQVADNRCLGYIPSAT